MKKLFSTFLIILFMNSPLGAETFDSQPQVTVQKLLKKIGQIKSGLSGQEELDNQKYSQFALSYLNVSEISKKSLKKYWEKLSDTERERFQVLLSELFVHVAFPSSAKFFAELDLVYGKTKEKKTIVVVPVTVIHDKEGEVGIDFHLNRTRNKWQVVDVILDGVSMRNNLRSQFYKVIKKKNFKELLRKMENKLISSH